MTKGFKYWFRCVTVGTLATLITFNPAWAGRGLHRLFGKRASSCSTAHAVTTGQCCQDAPVACCPPVVDDCCASSSLEVDIPAPSTGCCGGDWSTMPPIVESPAAGSCTPLVPIVPAQPSAAEMSASPTPANAEPSSPQEASPEKGDHSNDTPPPAQSVPRTPEASPSDSASQADEVAPPAKSDEAKPAAPAPEPAPAPVPMPAPEVEQPSAPSDDIPASPSSDNPFPPSDKPLENTEAPSEPKASEPAPSDDLFGTPKAESAPALPGNDAATQPAPSSDDLFGAPATDSAPQKPADNDPFGAPAPATDDLFNTPAEPAPATDDLFNTPAEPAPATDDLFNTPAEPAPATDATDDDIFGAPSDDSKKEIGDDLFGNPTSAELRQPANAAGQSTSIEDDLFDLFGTPTVDEGAPTAVEPTSKAPAAAKPDADLFKSTRTWHDNTGLYRVDAKLVAISSDSIRLLKENGKYCTLPLRRLSESDKLFVENVASLSSVEVARLVSLGK